MSNSEEKKNLVKELDIYFKKMNAQRLYTHPDQEDTKIWLAEVASIFKNLDESDYKEFKNHRQHLYSVIDRPIRKHAAQQLENFTREKVAAYKRYNFDNAKESSGIYIKQEIIEGFISKQDSFSYKKLIRLLTELNSNFASGYPYSTSMLIRGILDHIPPLLGCMNFDQVVSNYPWGETDKRYMKSLLDFKNEGDDALHRQISEKADLLDMENIPNNNRINVLLQECLQGSKKHTPIVNKASEQKNQNRNIKINIVDGTMISWANYSQKFLTWSSFRVFLEIDNFNSKKPDYVRVSLQGKTIDGAKWIASHFIFQGVDRQDEEFRVEAEEVKRAHIFISDYPADDRTRKPPPEIDDNGLILIAKTKSSAEINILIPKEKIGRG